jgi:hypothetical protein
MQGLNFEGFYTDLVKYEHYVYSLKFHIFLWHGAD